MFATPDEGDIATCGARPRITSCPAQDAALILELQGMFDSTLRQAAAADANCLYGEIVILPGKSRSEPLFARRLAPLRGLVLAPRLSMRVLVVLSDPVEADVVRQRCGGLVADGHDLAVCYVMAARVTLDTELEAQRKVTATLRRALDRSAETIAVFVVSQVDGDGVVECAREWGATEVRT